MIFMMKVSLSLIFCFFVVKSKAGGDYTVDRNDFSYSREEDITPYKPEWTSLDNRPSPKWYDDAKIGIFLHWGIYSVPGFGSEWFWSNWKEETSSTKYRDFMKERYPPKFTYQEFAKDFTAEFFNATQWAEIFDAAGAKYVVLTSKHHEGYTLWPSKYSFSWNSMDVGPNRDLIDELSTAIRKNTNIKFGLYHSLYEWYNPLYLRDKANAFETNEFSTQKVYPEMIELVEKYQPEIFWSDGEWDAPDTYWKSKEFLAWLFNDSPVSATVVVNDRWGKDTLCRHGGFYTCTDRYNPGHLITHKWENAMTIDRKSWGFRRNAPLEDYFSIKELVKELASTVSCGGNLLMNVGPTKDGIIAPIFEDRLRELGKWLKVNGEAIYKTKPWIFQNDTITGDVWYTISSDEQSLYAIMLSWPEDDILKLGAIPPTSSLKFKFLGYTNILEWEKATKGVSVNLPPRVNRGQPGWAIKITTPEKYTQILSKKDIYLSEN